MKLRASDCVWLFLFSAMVLTWWLDASGLLGTPASRWAVPLIFALAWLKGLGVALEFMELRHAPALWRRAMLGLFSLMLALVMLAWLIAGR